MANYVGNIEEVETLIEEAGWVPRNFLPLMKELDDIKIAGNQAKIKLGREIDKAKSATKSIRQTCNAKELIDNLQNIYVTDGSAEALSDFFHSDKDIRSLKKESLDLSELGDDIRYRFLRSCMCQKKNFF